MVPYKLSLMHSDKNSQLRDTLSYLASFGIASIVVTPASFALYWLATCRSRQVPHDNRNSPDASISNLEGRGDDPHHQKESQSQSQNQSPSDGQWKLSILPGLSSGILWAAANIMSVHATWFLGMKVGFPLTQTCVVFNAMWGILYFKEIDVMNIRNGNLVRFLVGLVAIVLGSYFLAGSAA